MSLWMDIQHSDLELLIPYKAVSFKSIARTSKLHQPM